MRHGRARAVALWLPLLLATLVRAYPMHLPYLGLELQEMYPKNAITVLARHGWEPVALMHGGALLTVLRAMYTAWYAIGHVAGLYPQRVDVLAAYARDPFPFVVAARLVVLACALASVALVAHLGTRLAGTGAAAAGALLLAFCFIHVRETHHVWMDVPASATALLVVIASLRAMARPALSAVAAMGLAGGVALATKYSMFPVGLPVLLAIWWGARRPADVPLRAVVAAVPAVAVFALLSPYAFVKFHETVEILVRLRGILFEQALPSLSLWTCFREGIGTGVVALALAGLVATAITTPRRAVIAAAFPIAYTAVLASQSVVYSRYLAVLAPFTALFAGAGAVALGRAVAPARPWLVAGVLVLAAGVPTAVQSVGYDRFLALRDTRHLAAEWIQAHVPPGTPLTVPNAVGYANPALPLDALQVKFGYGDLAPVLRERGIGDPARSWPLHYLAFFDQRAENWTPEDRFVVTALHPIVIRDWYPSPAQMATLAAAGAREVARFDGFVDPIPERVVFERVEFDYIPMSGFDALLRPGPNLTIWELPQPAAASREDRR